MREFIIAFSRLFIPTATEREALIGFYIILVVCIGVSIIILYS